MSMTATPLKTRRDMYDVSFGGQPLGGLQNVDLSGVKLKLQAVMIGSLGAIKLDDRCVGIEDGSIIKVVVVQTDREMLNTVLPLGPGSGTATAALELVPPVNTLLNATYGKALLIHPRDQAAGISEDIEVYKAVQVGPPVSRTGIVDDAWELSFMLYPDLTKLPGNAWWRFKAGV